MDMSSSCRAVVVALLMGMLASCQQAVAPPAQPAATVPVGQQSGTRSPAAPQGPTAIDHWGRQQRGRQTGEASWYGVTQADRKMADGRYIDPQANVAASRTLPLGSTAKVTNLENGRSTTVTIEDRGPFVRGRVVDVSPHAAEELAIKKQGVARVSVKPITAPQPTGAEKPSAGVSQVTSQ
jgi:rare lipoprotein A